LEKAEQQKKNADSCTMQDGVPRSRPRANRLPPFWDSQRKSSHLLRPSALPPIAQSANSKR